VCVFPTHGQSLLRAAHGKIIALST